MWKVKAKKNLGDTEPPNNMSHNGKHTSSSILSYRVGLDSVATSYLIL